MSVYRVLIVGMTPTPGGVEAFIYNYYSHMDHTKIVFDFLCAMRDPIAYENFFKQEGSRIYHIESLKKDPIKYKKELKTLFQTRAEDYQAIWVNVNALTKIDYLVLAKKYGIQKRIIHSHNSANMGGKVVAFLHKINRERIGRYATDFWACSDNAAKWFYNKELFSKSVVIHNAIDVEKYRFNDQVREAYRKKIGWENNIVLGNVGRLHFQKNQELLLEILKELLKYNNKYRLMIIGSGPDEKALKDKAEALGIQECVRFLGNQYDVENWLSSMDLFVFPSRFEGLSIVALEAQANGLPIIASEKAVNDEGILNPNISIIPLEHSANEWAYEINNIVINKEKLKRLSFSDIDANFISRRFEINKEAAILQNMFLKDNKR